MIFLASPRDKDGDKTRAALMQVIRAQPGIHLADLASAAGYAWSTVDHHVRILRRSGYIQVQKSGRESFLFPQDVDVAQHDWFRVLRDAGTLKVLRHVVASPGISGPELGSLVGFSEKVMRRHLLELGEAGLMLRRGSARPRFEANPEALRRLPDALRQRLLGDGMAPDSPHPPG